MSIEKREKRVDVEKLRFSTCDQLRERGDRTTFEELEEAANGD